MRCVSAFSRALRHHFAKIKDADSAIRLEKIWVEEGLQSEQVALDFIVARSYGSFRDVETMLDQLSLLGKIITISLVHKLVSVMLCFVRVCFKIVFIFSFISSMFCPLFFCWLGSFLIMNCLICWTWLYQLTLQIQL